MMASRGPPAPRERRAPQLPQPPMLVTAMAPALAPLRPRPTAAASWMTPSRGSPRDPVPQPEPPRKRQGQRQWRFGGGGGSPLPRPLSQPCHSRRRTGRPGWLRVRQPAQSPPRPLPRRPAPTTAAAPPPLGGWRPEPRRRRRWTGGRRGGVSSGAPWAGERGWEEARQRGSDTPK